MHKPSNLPFKIFSAQLTELKNYVPLFPLWIDANRVAPEELNKILLQDVQTNGQSNTAYKDGTLREIPTR